MMVYLARDAKGFWEKRLFLTEPYESSTGVWCAVRKPNEVLEIVADARISPVLAELVSSIKLKRGGCVKVKLVVDE